jgi:prolipoprotein diacylglyceryltransferase
MQFVALSAISRLFFEAFRGDSLVTVNNLRVAQIIAWMVLAMSLWSIFRLRWNQRPSLKNSVK